MDIIYRIKTQNTDLKEAEIKGLLYLLLNEASLTNSSLIQLTGLPKETLRQFKSSISAYLDTPKGDEVKLNDLGKTAFAKLHLRAFPWSMVTYEDHELSATLLTIRKQHNLTPKREYDQFFATVTTSVSKAEVLVSKIDLDNKSVALLGDDDLVSILLGLRKEKYKEIYIFDVDEGILSTIENIAKEHNLQNIYTVNYDARNEVPTMFQNRFDVVMTDPPYTRAGISLFLDRAIAMARVPRDNSGPYIYMFYGNSFKEPDKILKVQEVLQKHNLLVEDKIDKFARYEGAESIGSASALYILKKTKHTKTISDYLNTEIYTFENVYEEQFPYVDHFVFKLFQVPSHVLSSKKALQKALGQFCNWHKLNVVDVNLTKFKGGGITLTYVLSQSNLVVHTWPEKGALHVDLITCSPMAKKERFAENLSTLFGTKHLEVRSIE